MRLSLRAGSATPFAVLDVVSKSGRGRLAAAPEKALDEINIESKTYERSLIQPADRP
jgi:hypothetical protein